MWDKNKGNFIYSFQGQCFLGICLEGRSEKKGVHCPYFLYTMYFPWKKRNNGVYLMEKRKILKDLWCCVGDFNATRLVV